MTTNIAELRLEAANNGELDGQAMRLIRKARYFSTDAELAEWVSRLDDETWDKWVSRLARDLASN